MSDKVSLNYKVLQWARESAKISLEVASEKVAVTPERLKAWEEGIDQPTIKKAETLAKLYRRPFALFFLPEIPRDFQPLQDFRKKDSKRLSTASVFIIREIQQKQSWIREVYEDNEEKPLAFVGKFSINDNPEKVAKDILSTLEINPSVSNPIKEWIDKAEAKGIFISRTSFIHSHMTLDSEEIQGFAIADPLAPFVFINSEDWVAPQLFTLVHELAHIWIAATGISNEIEPKISDGDKVHPIEHFCNEVAANALLPSEIMTRYNFSVFLSGKNIFAAAKKMGVSSFAFLVRALNLKLISSTQYNKLKAEAEAEFKAFLIREKEREEKEKRAAKEGGPSYYLLQLNKNGKLFTQVVLSAFHGGFLEPNIASALLNIHVNNFHKLEARLYK